MTTVGENADKLKMMFPQLDLGKFITDYGGSNLEWAGAYILENMGKFGLLERRADGDANQEEDLDAEDTMELEIDSPRAPKGVKCVDLRDPDFLNALERLAEYFMEMRQQPREPFLDEMPRVRGPLLDILLNRTKYDLQSIFTFLFFVNNNLWKVIPFSRIVHVCKSENNVGPKTFVRLTHAMLRAKKAEANLEGRDQFLPAIADFQKKLTSIARTSSPTFRDLRWRRACVGDVMEAGDDASTMGSLTFECTVCFESYPLKLGFHCHSSNPSPMPGEPCSSNQIVDFAKEHMFCLECIRGQAQATLSGAMLEQSGRGIQCLAPDCKNPILFDQIRPYISKTLRVPLEKKLLNHNLNVANIKHLERCLKCDFAMDMDVPKELNKVFRCLSCRYEYCRFCEADWSKHFGISCDEVREKSKEAAQHNLENKLSEAIIRFCPRCKLQFVKLDACNKMTCCNCRLTICYICRATNIEYSHFCNHIRDPNFPDAICKGCKVKKCLLWEDYRKHDEAKIKDILDENKNPVLTEGMMARLQITPLQAGRLPMRYQQAGHQVNNVIRPALRALPGQQQQQINRQVRAQIIRMGQEGGGGAVQPLRGGLNPQERPQRLNGQPPQHPQQQRPIRQPQQINVGHPQHPQHTQRQRLGQPPQPQRINGGPAQQPQQQRINGGPAQQPHPPQQLQQQRLNGQIGEQLQGVLDLLLQLEPQRINGLQEREANPGREETNAWGLMIHNVLRLWGR